MAPAQKVKGLMSSNAKKAGAARSRLEPESGVAKQKENKADSASRNGKKKQTPWQKVKVADDLLLGSTEYGFMGLEEFTPEQGVILGPNLLHESQPVNDQHTTLASEHDQVSSSAAAAKRKRSREETRSRARADGNADLHTLRPEEGGDHAAMDAQGVKAKTKNKPSKSKAAKTSSQIPSAVPAEVHEAPQSKGSVDSEPLAKRPRKFKKSRDPELASSSRNQAPSQPKSQGSMPVDSTHQLEQPSSGRAGPAAELSPNAWQQFELHASLEGALLAQGFLSPTPIQEACLMPAIRGRCDVIGAAQTVCLHLAS